MYSNTHLHVTCFRTARSKSSWSMLSKETTTHYPSISTSPKKSLSSSDRKINRWSSGGPAEEDNKKAGRPIGRRIPFSTSGIARAWDGIMSNSPSPASSAKPFAGSSYELPRVRRTFGVTWHSSWRWILGATHGRRRGLPFTPPLPGIRHYAVHSIRARSLQPKEPKIFSPNHEGVNATSRRRRPRQFAKY
jgi:hypothetical protein